MMTFQAMGGGSLADDHSRTKVNLSSYFLGGLPNFMGNSIMEVIVLEGTKCLNKTMSQCLE